jgi:hypothetical protein
VVALAVVFLIGFLGVGVVMWYGNRRPLDATLSWGEAIAAATFAFFLMFWWYGVIPHQWLTVAGNEWNWRPDRILVEPGQFATIFGVEIPITLPPFTMSYETLSHIIVVGIYGLALVLHVYLFMWWQNRGKRQEAALAVVPTSQYGRPLVRAR